MAIVKRETEHFARSVKQAKREKKLKSKGKIAGEMQATVNSDRLQETNVDMTASDHSSRSSKDASSAVTSNLHSEHAFSKKPKDKPANSDFLRHIFSGGYQQ